MNKYLKGGKASIMGAIALLLTKKGAQEQLAALYAQAFVQMAGGEERAAQVLLQAVDGGLDPAEFIVQALQQASSQLVAAARHGMKLNYLHNLKQNCPAGTKPMYFKVGGTICHKCAEIQKNKIKAKANGGEAVSSTVDNIRTEMARCGKKIKK